MSSLNQLTQFNLNTLTWERRKVRHISFSFSYLDFLFSVESVDNFASLQVPVLLSITSPAAGSVTESRSVFSQGWSLYFLSGEVLALNRL